MAPAPAGVPATIPAAECPFNKNQEVKKEPSSGTILPYPNKVIDDKKIPEKKDK